MLHEILLSLSGLQSPIWPQTRESAGGNQKAINEYTSPPERAMLETLSHLHDLHLKIRDAVASVSSSHQSMVCRAVASSIADIHLGKFVDDVIHCEASILQKDAAYVGAYEIVPLSSLVTAFAPWTKRLEWLCIIAQHLVQGSRRNASSGAGILDLLEKERHTGFSDIEDMALALLAVAQRAWMRSASLWILYGKLPVAGGGDFCIKPNPRPTSATDNFILDPSLTPKFVNTGARNALLSAGTALSQLRTQTLSGTESLKGVSDPSMTLLPRHLELLGALRYPLNTALFESILTSINQSISENALSQILPRSMILHLLGVIQRYLLLDRGEFAVSLVNHADERITSRQQTQTAPRPIRKVGRIDDLTVKEADLNSTLAKTMADLAALQGDDDVEDDLFNSARKLLSLKAVDEHTEPRLISTLLPTPTLLQLMLPRSSPLHIFLSSADSQTYAVINSYLVSIHRAGLHLSALWKLSSHRRCHPTPLGPPRSASAAGQAILATRRARDGGRVARTRGHWTCASKTLFLVNELEAYLQGEVIKSSWTHFQNWLNGGDGVLSRPGTASSAGQNTATAGLQPIHDEPEPPADPRAMAEAHRTYLNALYTALFLSDDEFVLGLKDLLTQVDHFIALFSRLQTIWEGLDLQEDDGVVDAFSNYAQDEREVLGEMDRMRDVIESSISALVTKIRDVEKENRTGVGIEEKLGDMELKGTKFVAWHARTIDRLVMKIDSLTNRLQDDDGDDMDEGVVHDYDGD